MSATLIHNVRIFDGHSVLTENGFVYLKDGLIRTVAPGTPPPSLRASNTVDGKGHTILPGLIDAHVHCFGESSTLALCLKFGVTTILDMFNEPEHFRKLKEMAGQSMDIADLRTSGWAAMVKNGWPRPIVMATTPEEKKDERSREIESWPVVEEGDEEDWVKERVKEGSE
jgi:predicted amidohydrolase YtcJ